MLKPKLIIIGCLAAIALSASAASTASAATSGWMVNGTLLSGSKSLSSTVTVTENSTLEAAGVSVKCAGPLRWLLRRILAIAHAIFLAIFGGCTAQQNCTVAKELSTVPITATEITLEGTSGVKGVLKPETKTTLATILYEGALCALEGVQPVTGKLKFLGPLGQTEMTSQPASFFTEAAGELKIGSSEAKIKGAGEVSLESHEPWSFL
jgi:hypothetical protein